MLKIHRTSLILSAFIVFLVGGSVAGLIFSVRQENRAKNIQPTYRDRCIDDNVVGAVLVTVKQDVTQDELEEVIKPLGAEIVSTTSVNSFRLVVTDHKENEAVKHLLSQPIIENASLIFCDVLL